jgi:hypothetical protein
MQIALFVLSGALLVAGFVVVLVVSILRIGRRVAAKAAASAMTDPHLVGVAHLTPTLFGGGAGDGVPRVHGNGVIGMSRDEVTFVLAAPRRVITIPRTAITGASVDTTLRVPGRIRMGRRPWLMIHWTDSAGGAAVAGFLLAEPQRWCAELLGRPGSF